MREICTSGSTRGGASNPPPTLPVLTRFCRSLAVTALTRSCRSDLLNRARQQAALELEP